MVRFEIRCESCDKLFCLEEELSTTEAYRFGNICKSCLEKLMQEDEYLLLSEDSSRSREMNNFSFWYPKIKDCGIKTPKSLIFKVPESIQELFAKDGCNDEEFDAIAKWVKREILPVLEKENMYLLFVKNATFSNKFDAKTCMTTPRKLAEDIISINYASLCLGAGGFSEIIVRERIMHAMQKTPCIYDGLPLRTEFRVFYDFTKKKIIFVENYWKYDYVFPRLYNVTDRIIFEHERTRIENEFESQKQEVEKIVAAAMENVDELEGPWSVDIMCEDGEYYLIDMALAEMSAYWANRPSYAKILAREKEVAKNREGTERVIRMNKARVKFMEDCLRRDLGYTTLTLDDES